MLPEDACVELRGFLNGHGVHAKVLEIGRGGLLLDTDSPVATGDQFKATVADLSDGSRCEVTVEVIYCSDRGVGCRFLHLDVAAAVEVGVWIGRYLRLDRH
jgi:hypothetical protein